MSARLIIVGGIYATLQPGVYCGGLKITNGASGVLSKGIFIIKDGPLIVDGGASISQRPDGRRMESGRMLDPAGQAWRRQAHGDHARGGERPDVHSVDRLSVAGDPEIRYTFTERSRSPQNSLARSDLCRRGTDTRPVVFPKRPSAISQFLFHWNFFDGYSNSSISDGDRLDYLAWVISIRSLICLLDLDLPPDFHELLRRNVEQVHRPH
jgi:hypothetical protein